MILVRNITIPALTGDKTRRLYLYLPESYDSFPDRRYPVLYMFDGHNVFYDCDATYGKSWGMREYMERSGTQMIIAAVECNHEGDSRLAEYSPISITNKRVGSVHGLGPVYMDWLTSVLKPSIDKEFRTLPDRTHTFIAGSSMGGLMALYAAGAYNAYFSKAACLSPSLWLAPEAYAQMLADASYAPGSCIYIDYGSEELHNHADSPEALLRAVEVLIQKQTMLTFRIVPGGTHCEASWERQIPVFMKCFGLGG